MTKRTDLHHSKLELSIVMPCLNEAETLGQCIQVAQQAIAEHHIDGEVIVADNGSWDNSRAIAESHGARLVRVEQKGYGSALMGGIDAADGCYIMMGDADASYDFGQVMSYIAQLRLGFDLVMGNRFAGGIAPGAMPFLHRYLGNPVLSAIGRRFFCCACSDFHCGLRAFSKEAFCRMDLRSTGMEFASEMVVKATLLGMRITQVPTTLVPDGRRRPPHLNTWRDGWRHLRFFLLYSPRWLFLYPGFLLIGVGLSVGLSLLAGPLPVGDIVLDVHTLAYTGLMVMIGFQAIVFSLFTSVFTVTQKLVPASSSANRILDLCTLERGLLVGGLLGCCGLAGSIFAVFRWGVSDFGPLSIPETLRIVIPSVVSLTLGCQVVLASFFMSVLALARR